jgi:hypothetical protein
MREKCIVRCYIDLGYGQARYLVVQEPCGHLVAICVDLDRFPHVPNVGQQLIEQLLGGLHLLGQVLALGLLCSSCNDAHILHGVASGVSSHEPPFLDERLKIGVYR